MSITDISVLMKEIVDCSGFMNSALIKQKDVVYDQSFRDICLTNQCGEVGRCWMCPPDVGDPVELMSRCRSFPDAVLFQSFYQLEDSLDLEGMQEGRKAFIRCASELTAGLCGMQEKGMIGADDYMQLGVGGCGICDVCAKRENRPCRYPDLAKPSMESCGIFVSATAANAGIRYINGPDTVTYFGILFFR